MLSKEQIEIIKKHNNYKDLAKNHPPIAFLIKKHHIAEFYPDKYQDRLPQGFWTKELVFAYGKLCRTRHEFHKLFPGAYDLAQDKGWLSKIMKHKLFWFENIRKHTLPKLLSICKKHKLKTYSEFIEKFPSEYQQAFQQGWTPQIKEYFKLVMIEEMPSDEELADQIINKQLPISDKRLQSYFKLLPEKRKSVQNLIIQYKDFLRKKRNEEIAKKRLIIKELKDKKLKLIKKSPNGNGEISNADLKVKHNIRYTEQEIYDVAKQYNTRKEFGLKNKGAYEAAIRRKIIEKVCAHMTTPYESLGEQLVRKAFDYHFGKIFYKLKPDWLINPKTNRRMELDGFNDELQIAFEVQGGHHYESIYHDFKLMEAKDKVKVVKCVEMGIKLYVFKYKSLEQLELDLHREFGISREWLRKVSFDLQETLSNEEIEKYRNLIKLNKPVEKMSYKTVARLINELRKQNLTNLKIQQVLKVSKAHFSHRIRRINKLKIPLIHR